MKYEFICVTHCEECRHAQPIEGFNTIACTRQFGTVHPRDGFCDFGLPSPEKLKEIDEGLKK